MGLASFVTFTTSTIGVAVVSEDVKVGQFIWSQGEFRKVLDVRLVARDEMSFRLAGMGAKRYRCARRHTQERATASMIFAAYRAARTLAATAA